MHRHWTLWCCGRFVSTSKGCVWLGDRWPVWTGTTGSPATRWWRCWGSTGTASWPCWRPSSTTRCSTGGSWTVRDHQLPTFSRSSEGTQTAHRWHVADSNGCNSITWLKKKNKPRKIDLWRSACITPLTVQSKNPLLKWFESGAVKFNPTGLKRLKCCPSSEMEIDFAGIWERNWPNAQRSVVDIWRSLVKLKWAKWMNDSSTLSANTVRVALSKTFSLPQKYTMPEMLLRLFWSLRNVGEMRFEKHCVVARRVCFFDVTQFHPKMDIQSLFAQPHTDWKSGKVISGASQHSSVAAFSSTTEVNGNTF